jgi:hypothetical protein
MDRHNQTDKADGCIHSENHRQLQDDPAANDSFFVGGIRYFAK